VSLTDLSATRLAAEIRARETSAREVVEAFLGRIERLNPVLNAVVHLDAAGALEAATRADRTEPRGRLHGVPILLKDAHRVVGMPTIVGNPDAATGPAPRDGYVAARLRAAGAIILGKTNVPRDLADFQTDNPVFGRTCNAWDVDRTPGGSSGGAAAALAARLTPIEVGSDIAGSIRLPAHFCGVIGFKPTAGLVSLAGHVTEPARRPRGGAVGVGALATIGPMARDLDDIELLLELLAPAMPLAARQSEPRLRLGIVPAFAGLRVENSIRDAVDALGLRAERGGASVDQVELGLDIADHHAAWVSVYTKARRHGAGWARRAEVARLQADAARAWDEALAGYDAIVCPAAMCVAFTHRPTGTPIEVDGVPVPYWGLARYTEPLNLTGHPAAVLPVGLDPSRLPIGVQVVGTRGADAGLLAILRWLAGVIEPMGTPRLDCS